LNNPLDALTVLLNNNFFPLLPEMELSVDVAGTLFTIITKTRTRVCINELD
jgi:hypothetical protein